MYHERIFHTVGINLFIRKRYERSLVGTLVIKFFVYVATYFIVFAEAARIINALERTGSAVNTRRFRCRCGYGFDYFIVVIVVARSVFEGKFGEGNSVLRSSAFRIRAVVNREVTVYFSVFVRRQSVIGKIVKRRIIARRERINTVYVNIKSAVCVRFVFERHRLTEPQVGYIVAVSGKLLAVVVVNSCGRILHFKVFARPFKLDCSHSHTVSHVGKTYLNSVTRRQDGVAEHLNHKRHFEAVRIGFGRSQKSVSFSAGRLNYKVSVFVYACSHIPRYIVFEAYFAVFFGFERSVRTDESFKRYVFVNRFVQSFGFGFFRILGRVYSSRRRGRKFEYSKSACDYHRRRYRSVKNREITDVFAVFLRESIIRIALEGRIIPCRKRLFSVYDDIQPALFVGFVFKGNSLTEPQVTDIAVRR